MAPPISRPPSARRSTAASRTPTRCAWRREQRHEPPPVAVDLPAHVRTRDAPVQPHRLEAHDQLMDHLPADAARGTCDYGDLVHKPALAGAARGALPG